MEEKALPSWQRLKVALQQFLCEVVPPLLATHGVAEQRQTELADWTRHVGFRHFWSSLAAGDLYPRENVGSLHASAQFALGVR